MLALTFALLQTGNLHVELFVMTDCPISRQYLPEVKRIQKDYGINIRLIQEDPHTTATLAKKFNSEFGLAFPFTLDGSHRRAKQLGVKTVPTVVLLSGDKVVYFGRIDDRFPTLGVQRKPSRRDLRIAIEEVRAGKPVSVARTNPVGCVLP